jgi:hypothetical protein
MTTWLYLGIFIFLNVVVWIGLERINRHLAEITRQLGTAVALLDRLNQNAGPVRRQAGAPPDREGERI